MACGCTTRYKPVPVTTNNQSSDLFTPDEPVRATQTNVGQYFVREDQNQDKPINQFGYPASPPLKPRDRPPHLGNAPPCSQKQGQYDPAVPPPGQEAHLISEMHKYNKAIKDPLPYKKQLFPRARGYELKGFKEKDHHRQRHQYVPAGRHIQNQYAYSPETGLRLNCSSSYRSDTLNPYFYNPVRNWYPEPQFWYFGSPQPLTPTWPVGNPDDYDFQKPPYPSEGITLLEKLEVERPERYLPGEIYRDEPVKRPIEDLSKKANCSKVWKPKDPTFCIEFQPDEKILNRPLLLDEVLLRKAQNRGRKERCRCSKPVCSCRGIEDKETREKNEKDPNTRVESVEVGVCEETCDFGPDMRPKPDACDLSKKKSKLPIGVMKKIDPHIDEQEYLHPGHNWMNQMRDKQKVCNCGCKEKKRMVEENIENDTRKKTTAKCKCGKGYEDRVLHYHKAPRDEKPRRPCEPIEPGFQRFDPSVKRACELSKVGQPFKSDAILKHRCIHPPPDFVPIYREGKRKFPDFGLSHI